MPQVVTDGNLPSCTGKGGGATGPPKQKSKEKVRIGSSYFSKDTRTERRFNVGMEVGKAPSGVRFRTLNELVVDKQIPLSLHTKLPTYPGDEYPQERGESLLTIEEEGVTNIR